MTRFWKWLKRLLAREERLANHCTECGFFKAWCATETQAKPFCGENPARSGNFDRKE